MVREGQFNVQQIDPCLRNSLALTFSFRLFCLRLKLYGCDRLEIDLAGLTKHLTKHLVNI